MATGYWAGPANGIWENNSNWAPTSSGSPPSAYPQSGGNDSARFAASSYSGAAITANLSTSILITGVQIMHQQSNGVTINGSGSIDTGGISTGEGSGDFTFDVTVNIRVSCGNISYKTMTFLKPVTTSAPISISTGSGKTANINFTSGLDASGAASGYRRLDVSNNGTGLITFSSLTNVTNGINLYVGNVQITAAGSTPVVTYPNTIIRLGTGTQTGLISGDGVLSKSTTGTLMLSNINTHTGGTAVTSGTLVWSSGSLGATGNITINGGVLQWGTGNTTDVSSRLTLVNNGSATLNTGTNDITLNNTFGSNSSSSISKFGSSSLFINAPATFSGGSLISEGTIKTGNINALGTGPVVLSTNTTLKTSSVQPKLTLGGKFTNNGGNIHIGG
jgi:fibronectin-binding autotransporter adhesin